MTTGTDSMRGLYVPLYGNFTIKARVGATDIVTIEGAGSTGDFIVCRSSGGTEAFSVADGGEITATEGMTLTCSLVVGKAITATAGDVTVTAGDVQITNGYFLRFTSWPTTMTSATAITLGDVWLLKSSSELQIAIAQSTSVIRYINTTSA